MSAPTSERGQAKISNVLKHYAVSANDTDFTHGRALCLYVGTGGDVEAIASTYDESGEVRTTVTYKNVPSGTFLPVAAIQLASAGTTASDIVACY